MRIAIMADIGIPIELHVRTMLEKAEFLNDGRVTPDLVGKASSGDLIAYDQLLVIYRDHVSGPPPFIGQTQLPDSLGQMISELRQRICDATR